MSAQSAAAGRSPRLNREAWIEAALAALAAAGIDAVRVEPLAKRLGVTKGGFYWHFRDRADLLAAILAHWQRGRMAAIDEHAAAEPGGAAQALERLLDKYIGHRNPRGLILELAIRQWARQDAEAARVVAAVDAYRLERVAALYRELGLDAETARSRAYLFYAYVFGQGLLLDPPDAARARELCHRLLLAGPA